MPLEEHEPNSPPEATVKWSSGFVGGQHTINNRKSWSEISKMTNEELLRYGEWITHWNRWKDIPEPNELATARIEFTNELLIRAKCWLQDDLIPLDKS